MASRAGRLGTAGRLNTGMRNAAGFNNNFAGDGLNGNDAGLMDRPVT